MFAQVMFFGTFRLRLRRDSEEQGLGNGFTGPALLSRHTLEQAIESAGQGGCIGICVRGESARTRDTARKIDPCRPIEFRFVLRAVGLVRH